MSGATPSGPKPGVMRHRRLTAAIDVGAGAVRMDIAEIGGDKEVRILDTLFRAVSLGRDTFTSGRISAETTDRCVGILRDFRQAAEEFEGGAGAAMPIRAVGTSALREAENREAFLDRVFIATGIHIEVIEEPEVHRLTYMALHRLLGDQPFMKQGEVLVVEVGGGGTKVLLIQDGFVTCSETFRLGSLRVREALESDDESESHAEEALGRQIERMMDQIRRTVPVKRVSHLVAVVGDLPGALMRALGAGAEGAKRPSVCSLGARDFRRAREIADKGESDLMRDYGLSPREAAAVGPALMTYLSLAREFRVKTVILARVDLRLGLLFNAVLRGAWTAHFSEQIIRSALALGAKYAFDKPHALHVTELAVALFRELAPDHNLDPRQEILLRVAGILHDIGTFVSSRSHHKHSSYLIASSELFGLTTRDTGLIALVARYHRRSPPAPAHPDFARLDRADRALVLQLSAILRVADALDRSHSQRIHIAGFLRTGDELSLGVEDVGDLSLERVALETKGGLFATVYGMRVTIRPTVMPGIR
jgi:exopolyphosphatase/guanosine-5'-triphosphate,3'-diphosphate pyrophosphatase